MAIKIKAPPAATITIATPQDFPTIWEMLAELSRVPGPPGPIGPAGVPGPKGDTGTPGPVSITVGTTTTGAAGSSASVVNSGSPTAQVLDFTIPQGATGPTGAPGGSLVTSVAGKTGAVTLAKADVGLTNVDNTADTAKPVSTAQQAALDLKQNLAAKNAAGGYCGLDGTGKVDAAQLPAASTSLLIFKDVKGTSVANSGTGETAAWSFNIPANTFDADGRTLDLEIFYVLGSSTNSKTLRVKVGSSVVYNPGFGETNNALVFAKLHIVRNGSTSFTIGHTLRAGASYGETGGMTLGGQNFANIITINVTVQGPSSGQTTFQNGRALIV
jgi:hypothetical protein